MTQNHRRNALLGGKRQTTGIRAITHHGGNTCQAIRFPRLLLRALHDGLHIAAATGNQNHDVFQNTLVFLINSKN